MIVFDASKIISYKNFSKYLEKQKIIFNSSKQAILDKCKVLEPVAWSSDVEKYQEFRKQYRALVREVILNVISEFRCFLPDCCLIVQFGSLVKHTDRIASDVDLTICYDELKTEKYECAEELIDFAIVSILGYSIDHIHGKFQHYPEMHDFDEYTEKDNFYRLKFFDGYIDYKCGPETLKENLTNIKNVRDYASMINGYEEKYLKKCNIDCLYSIEILENSTEHDFIGDLSNLEMRYNICDGYKFKLSKSALNENFQISRLKHILKNDGIVEFYIFVSKLRKELRFNPVYSMNVDELWDDPVLINTFGVNYMEALKISFVKFIFYWNRIELSLNRRNIALSTRCYRNFTIAEINSVLEEDWGCNTTIANIIASKNDLIKLVDDGLRIFAKK